jgi:hypothetical protein
MLSGLRRLRLKRWKQSALDKKTPPLKKRAQFKLRHSYSHSIRRSQEQDEDCSRRKSFSRHACRL